MMPIHSECRFARQGPKIICPACGFSLPWPADLAPPRRACQAPAPRAAPAQPTACAHRGDVVRTEQCASCRNSTVEVSIHACAVHGECTLQNYARRNPQLAGLKVCQGCPDRKERSLPPLWKRALNFGGAIVRDLAGGRARRSPELVERIFYAHCAGCRHFVPAYDGAYQLGAVENGNCAECGCQVSRYSRGELNKLRWASESCPIGRWPVKTLNLIYYLLPLQNPANVWQWHVEQLRRRLSIFNGSQIITIATAAGDNRLALDTPETVRRAFGPDAARIEFLERPNSPQHWETPAFREMLTLIESRDPAEATFYFHAKGVRRARQDAVRPWSEAIYQHNLDRVDEVREILSAYACAGIAKIPKNPTNFPGGGNWHFAGTGFWFNHAALFSKPNWREITDHTHAVEGYLSTQFDAADAFCLSHENCGSVYSPSTWLVQGTGDRGQGTGQMAPTVSIIVTSRNYARYLRDCLASCLAQTHACEVIYCDDASEDDSVAVAREFDTVKVIALEKHLGAEEARNHAARHASGRAVLFVDGDNLLPTHYVARMVAKLTGETPFVYPDLQYFGDTTHLFETPEWEKGDLTKGNFCDTCSLIWLDAFEAVGAWKTGFASRADWHLFLRLSKLGKPARGGVALLYRSHGQNMSQLEKARMTEEEVRELERRVVADAVKSGE